MIVSRNKISGQSSCLNLNNLKNIIDKDEVRIEKKLTKIKKRETRKIEKK